MIRTQIGNLKPGDIILLPIVIRALDHYAPDDEPWSVLITARPANYTGTDFTTDEFDPRTVLKVDEHDQADREQYSNQIDARDAFLAEDAQRSAHTATRPVLQA